MNKNIKVAKELVKLAKKLIAENLVNDENQVISCLYDSIGLDSKHIENDYNNGYLSQCQGRDGITYYWYFDQNHNGIIPVNGGKVITDQKKIEQLFC